jgi:beta-lactamase regulating signal transducer with metallopeptidase domain
MTMASLTPTAAFALDAVVKATVLIAIVAVVARVLRKQPAALRHMVWSLGVVGLVTIPVLTGAMPFRIRMLPAASQLPSSAAPEQRSSAAAATDDAAAGSFSADQRAENKTGAASTLAAPAENESISIWSVLLWLWVGGTLALLLRFGSSLLVVNRITKRAKDVTDEQLLAAADRAARALGVSAALDIRMSDEVAMPFASGLFNPTIVLPASALEWTAERREAVLKHEIAHLTRGDLAMNTLSHFTRALYWFHPLAWLAAHKIRVEGERA